MARLLQMTTVIAVYIMALLISMPSFAADKKKDSAAPVADSKSSSSGDSDKVDLKKLEEKYWAAKDSDYSVIQNRAYPKEKRLFVTLGYGPLMNDLYSTGRNTDVAFGYFFSERFGIEATWERGNLADNDGVTKYRNDYGVSADYDRFVESINMMAILVPFYAKMSFFDQAIMYFDMQFALGVGQVSYDIVRQSGTENRKGTDIEFDITQQVFFSRYTAIRFDIKNKWYDQARKNYKTGADMGTSKAQDTSVLLGLTLFFP